MSAAVRRGYPFLVVVLISVLSQAGAFSSPSTSPFLRSSIHVHPSGCRAIPIALWDAKTSEEKVVDSDGVSSMRRSSNGRGGRLVGAGAVAAAAVTALAFPSLSHAIDLAGDASSLAASGNALLSSLTATGFYQAFSLVFVSEIGDKTFFMAGLLAMQTTRLISFLGSMAALAVMTLISVGIGQIFHVVPAGIADGIPLDDVAAVLAFTFFGVKTLKEALAMEGDSSAMDEELADAEETVQGSSTSKEGSTFARILSIFGLVFAAEFGDRSFLSTIALSAAQNPVSVAGGAVAAHAVATGIAVSGGAVVAKYLSERVIGIIGGSLFLVFALTTALGIF
jgi:putative Ca2+/H+ antiporter (TMEM165/GDT1 family)